jgi:hypothetical protein
MLPSADENAVDRLGGCTFCVVEPWRSAYTGLDTISLRESVKEGLKSTMMDLDSMELPSSKDPVLGTNVSLQ